MAGEARAPLYERLAFSLERRCPSLSAQPEADSPQAGLAKWASADGHYWGAVG